MIRALDRVGRLTGHVGSLRHGTIQERIEFVGLHAVQEETRRAWRTTLRRLHLGILALVVVAVAAAVIVVPRERRSAEGYLDYLDARDASDRAVARAEEGESEEARRLWADALSRYERAADVAGDRGGFRGDLVAVHAQHAAADTALRGLPDRARAKALYEGVIERARRPGLPAPEIRDLLFHTHVDLGRIAAGEGREEDARRHLKEAESRQTGASGRQGAYERARLSLLEWTIDARRGLVPAREELARLAQAPRYPGREWARLRQDAREELRLLAAVAPPGGG
jgi:hypothetical protein